MNKLRQAIVSSAIGKKAKNDTNGITRRYQFKSNFLGFSGHFPGYPILPAFVQMLTALTLIEEYKKCRLALTTVEKAKFYLPILPDQEIEVICNARQVHNKSSYEARLILTEGLASSFRFTFAEKRNHPC